MNDLLNPLFPAFAKRLKRQRIASGIKQEVLAHALAVNQTTVSRWENGIQTPDADMQRQAFECLSAKCTDDAALRRLVEGASFCVHLVDEASHECLAYSKSRAKDWNSTDRGMVGVSLWRFATEEIRRAETELEAKGWWDEEHPQPQFLVTSEAIYPELKISAGGMLWERMYLADGRPARLVTGL